MSELTFPIELKTRTRSYLKGKPCGKAYKWTIEDANAHGMPEGMRRTRVLCCYQPFTDPMTKEITWGKVGTWYVSNLTLYPHADRLYIDFGQDWMVTGLRKMLNEVMNTLYPVDTMAIQLPLYQSKVSLFDIEESVCCHIDHDEEYHGKLYTTETVLALINKVKELQRLVDKCKQEHGE